MRGVGMSEKRGKVLAVDDDPPVLESIVDALTTLGYEVSPALDGTIAVGKARAEHPDIVLLDVVMPGLDGFEVCRRLKSDPVTRLIPVVFLTGEGTRDARLAGLEAGATDFLSKGCDLTELDIRVRNLVSFRRLILELDSAEAILFAVGRMIEARDEGTGEHCDRVAMMAERFGAVLDLSEEDRHALHRGGYLHDLGKIGVPDAVLLKPGPLNEDEWAIMRQHVEIGARICAPLRTLRPVLPIIRHHHERFDGSGYPDGLAGEKIPFLARVFQVVDVFHALTSNRHYHKALSIDQAVATLRNETKRGFWDPKIVDVFIRWALDSL
ncbi:MAG: response regulator [Vicinamibacteria bacterium]|nr:response regulator [Vicinamibacteria bacterium]